MNLKIFWDESYRLDPAFIQQDSAERIFAIWTYLEDQNRNSDATQRIYRQRHEIFMRASRSIMETSSTTQIALDLMTMTSIARLFPHTEIVSRYESPVRALNTLSREIPVGQASFVFDNLLISLVRVCYYRVDLQPLIWFIDKILYPQSALSTIDSIGMDYISKRISGTAHYEVIKSIRDDTFLPSNLNASYNLPFYAL